MSIHIIQKRGNSFSRQKSNEGTLLIRIWTYTEVYEIFTLKGDTETRRKNFPWSLEGRLDKNFSPGIAVICKQK